MKDDMYSILIADDEKEEREVILFLLQKFSFPLKVLTASNGKEALGILQTKPVDILFTDIQMPFLSGLELASEARKLYPSIELLFFSGYDDFDYVKTALFLQAVNYILKPINPNEFQKTLSNVLQTLQKQKADFIQSERYIEDYFFRPSNLYSKTLTVEHSPSIQKSSSTNIEDNCLLKNIEESIKLKDSNSLESNVVLLLDKYKNSDNVSHLYIRYLCTSLLRLLFFALPGAEESSFQKDAEKIYTFHHFYFIYDYLKKILKLVLDDFSYNQTYGNHTIHQMEQYIHIHYKEPLSLNMIADHVYLSPKYISNIFSQETGCTINKYIRNIRMDKARELLLTSNMKIADISKNVGYTNVSYFCKCFQEDFGATPEKYRQNRGHDK